MKLYLCFALILTIIAIGIGLEIKKTRVKRSAMMRSMKPTGFITIEMDHDSESSSGWGSNSGWGSDSWSGGWQPQPRIQISIRKKMSLPPLGMMMMSHGWDDSTEEDGWSGGSKSSNYGSGGASNYGGSSSYGGGSDSYSSNGYDGNSGYSANEYRKKRSRS